jgi:hypothetical protein
MLFRTQTQTQVYLTVSYWPASEVRRRWVTLTVNCHGVQDSDSGFSLFKLTVTCDVRRKFLSVAPTGSVPLRTQESLNLGVLEPVELDSEDAEDGWQPARCLGT